MVYLIHNKERGEKKMKFYITSTSEYCFPQNGKVLNIDTLEDLITFFRAINQPLILDKNFYTCDTMIAYGCSRKKAEEIADCKYSIEIYDDYRE